MSFFAPDACVQTGANQRARHSTHYNSRAATSFNRIRRGLISGFASGGQRDSTPTIAIALRFPRLDCDADFTWQRYLAHRSVQELHADWFSILDIADDISLLCSVFL